MFELIPVVQAPQYDEEAEQRFAEEWPEFIFHDVEVRKYSERRTEYFQTDWEFYLISSDERLIAGCWGVPIAWDGTVDDLPGGFTDTLARSVHRGGRRIELKPKEYALLEYLMRNSGRPLTRALIVEHVWDIHFDSVSNVVEVHINSLRNKIDRGFPAPLIQTIRGVGYMLTDTPP